MTSKRKSPSKTGKAEAASNAQSSLASIRSIAKKTQASGDILRKITQSKLAHNLAKKLVNKPLFIDFHPFDDSVDQWQLDTFFTADEDTANAPVKTSSKVAMADFSKRITEAAKITPLKQAKRPSNLALVKVSKSFGALNSTVQHQDRAKLSNAEAADAAQIKTTASKLPSTSNSNGSNKITSNNRQTSHDTQVTAKSVFSVLKAMAKAADSIARDKTDEPTPSIKPYNNRPWFTRADAKPATLAQAASVAPRVKDSGGSEFNTEINNSQPSFTALTGLTELASQLWQLPSNRGNNASAPAMSRSTKPFAYRDNPGFTVATDDPFSSNDHFANTALEYSSRSKEQELEGYSSAAATAPAPATSPSDLAEAINGVLKEQAWLRGTHIP